MSAHRDRVRQRVLRKCDRTWLPHHNYLGRQVVHPG